MPVNAVGVIGNTPLMWAAYWDKSEIAAVLIANGADVNIQNTKVRQEDIRTFDDNSGSLCEYSCISSTLFYCTFIPVFLAVHVIKAFCRLYDLTLSITLNLTKKLVLVLG